MTANFYRLAARTLDSLAGNVVDLIDTRFDESTPMHQRRALFAGFVPLVCGVLSTLARWAYEDDVDKRDVKLSLIDSAERTLLENRNI